MATRPSPQPREFRTRPDKEEVSVTVSATQDNSPGRLPLPEGGVSDCGSGRIRDYGQRGMYSQVGLPVA